jgi:tetratricopeptide (TPR) repeat protein
MAAPRAVVIPFGVPDDGRGLGLGLAAVFHGFSQIDGHGVGIAQLHARKPPEEQQAGAPSPVEAFVPPHAWRDLAGAGNAPVEVTVVVTGAFEPPSEAGRGLIQVLAFDAQSGSVRARAESFLDDAHAGAGIVAAFDDVMKKVGGELGMMRALGELDWDALESVLRAERCVLHDPARGGPHDRLAALLHLGRAIGDAPDARFPVERLAQIALDTAMGAAIDAKLAQAALRALDRAAEDAPKQVEIVEATAALEIRLGRARSAEPRLNAAIAENAKRARLYVLLAQALRARGDRDGAATTLQVGLAAIPNDALILCERGVVFAEKGELDRAAESWRAALASEPLHPVAFGNLAGLAMAKSEHALAQSLVDSVLASSNAHPDVLRRSIHLALATETDGVARAARVARLARALVDKVPDDAAAILALARSLVQLGEAKEARELIAKIEQLAPGSSPAAEAQRARFALEHPTAAMEIEATLRAAVHAQPLDLNDVAVRARRLALAHGAWAAWLASAICERRLGRVADARAAAEAALKIAPGCAAAHAEMVASLVASGDPARAVTHAERALALEGESPRGLALLARALHLAGRSQEARAAIARAQAAAPNDDAVKRVAEQIRESDAPKKTAPASFFEKVRAWFGAPRTKVRGSKQQ